MIHDFDRVIDRSGTGSLKWGLYADKDVIPMWVADMDFSAPPVILDALQRRLEHGVLGYTKPSQAVVMAVVEGIHRLHGWAIEPQWLVWLPGLVPALHLVSEVFAEARGEVATFTPIYPPFLSAPPFVGRSTVTMPLVLRNGRYEHDLDALSSAVSEKTTVLLLCNPQNPTGRVFDKDELVAIHEFCCSRGIFVCSDEIHCDLVLDDDKRHIPFSSLSADAAAHSMVLMAPSKTFNVAGLNCSFAVVPDGRIRSKLKRSLGERLPHVNLLGLEACRAAYADGEPWRLQLIDYLRENRTLVSQRINAIPGMRMIPGEATFLAWIDCRATGLENPQAFFESAGVGLSDGTYFGASGFVRLNFGCSRTILRKALDRIDEAMHAR